MSNRQSAQPLSSPFPMVALATVLLSLPVAAGSQQADPGLPSLGTLQSAPSDLPPLPGGPPPPGLPPAPPPVDSLDALKSQLPAGTVPSLGGLPALGGPGPGAPAPAPAPLPPPLGMPPAGNPFADGVKTTPTPSSAILSDGTPKFVAPTITPPSVIKPVGPTRGTVMGLQPDPVHPGRVVRAWQERTPVAGISMDGSSVFSSAPVAPVFRDYAPRSPMAMAPEPGPASMDGMATVKLAGGKQFAGRVTDLGTDYRVALPAGGEVRIPKWKVMSVNRAGSTGF